MGEDDDEQRLSDSDSDSDSIEGSRINSNVGISEYEKRRMKTIEDNRKRMDALGLKKMATSLASYVKKRGDKKLVDEDYKPSDEEEEEEEEEEEAEGSDPIPKDAEFKDSPFKRNTKKTKNTVKISKKQKSSQKPKQDSLYVDDDKAMLQAIALSLNDNAGFIYAKKSASQISTAQNERNRNSQTLEDAEKGKRKKMTGSRVQMKEDELIMYFYQFDEMGKGSITLRDLQRVAAAHDFTWSDKEMADMIGYFDSDGDGKLNLDDLGKIADRCNMMIH